MAKVYLNLGSGHKQIPSTDEELWINVDRAGQVEPDFVWDLFKVPWPWKDSSIAGAKMSHFLEHVPHSLRPYNSPPMPWQKLKKRLLAIDGFFAVFEELGRILEPGGYVTVECPFAFTTGAMADPTHTRYLTLQTFGYLHKDTTTNAPFDYGFRYDFSLAKPADLTVEVAEGLNIADPAVLEYSIDHQLNALRNVIIKLTNNK